MAVQLLAGTSWCIQSLERSGLSGPDLPCIASRGDVDVIQGDFVAQPGLWWPRVGVGLLRRRTGAARTASSVGDDLNRSCVNDVATSVVIASRR